MSAELIRKPASSKTLVIAVLALTILVLGLGGAVIAVRLRPERLPTNSEARSVVSWEQAVAANPDDSEAHTGLGLALLDAGRDADAKTAFEEAVSLDDTNWMAALQLGLLMEEEAPARALQLLTAATKHASKTNKVLPAVALGDLQMALGDVDEAVRAYRIAVADAPYVLEGHLGLAEAYEAQGELDKAVREYRSAARFAPDHPEIVAALERLGADEG